MNYHQLTREVLEQYLPKFDPLYDLQLGEWVLVTPPRRSAIVEPLIEIVKEKGLKPNYPFLDDFQAHTASSSEAVKATNGALPELRNKEYFVHPGRIFLSLEESYKKYKRRPKHSRFPGAHESDVEDDTVLYLNYRALILTPSAPSVFGGSDFLEGLDKETNRIVFFNWKTGEMRTDTAALQPNEVPDWAAGVVEKAEEELLHWRRRHCHVSQVNTENVLTVQGDSETSPLRKSRRK